MWLTAIQASFLVYVSSVVIMCLKTRSLFSVHPIMMSLAFFLLMSEGVLFLYTKNVFTRKMKKAEKTKLHWIMQTLAVIAVCVGFIAIFLVKVSNVKDHFTTWHGLLGLITIIFVFFTVFIGVLTMYRMKMSHLIKPFRLKLIHGYAGIVTLILGFICVGFGYSSTWASEQLNLALQIAFNLGLVPLCVAFVYIFKHL